MSFISILPTPLEFLALSRLYNGPEGQTCQEQHESRADRERIDLHPPPVVHVLMLTKRSKNTSH